MDTSGRLVIPCKYLSARPFNEGLASVCKGKGGLKGLVNSVVDMVGGNADAIGQSLYIDDICVDEKARGKHVGKALYEYVRDYARSIGCNNITLNVWEGNDSAIRFYQNMGMHPQKIGMEIKL